MAISRTANVRLPQHFGRWQFGHIPKITSGWTSKTIWLESQIFGWPSARGLVSPTGFAMLCQGAALSETAQALCRPAGRPAARVRTRRPSPVWRTHPSRLASHPACRTGCRFGLASAGDALRALGCWRLASRVFWTLQATSGCPAPADRVCRHVQMIWALVAEGRDNGLLLS